MPKPGAIPYDEKSLRDLAEELAKLSKDVARVADNYRDEKVSEPLQLEGYVAIDRGMAGVERICLDAEKKIKAWVRAQKKG